MTAGRLLALWAVLLVLAVAAVFCWRDPLVVTAALVAVLLADLVLMYKSVF